MIFLLFTYILEVTLMVVLRKRDNSSDREVFDTVLFFLSYHIEDSIMKPFIPCILKSVYHIYLCNKDQTDDVSALG